jgi:hypothetical protein
MTLSIRNVDSEITHHVRVIGRKHIQNHAVGPEGITGPAPMEFEETID